jgi:hypothetical protein
VGEGSVQVGLVGLIMIGAIVGLVVDVSVGTVGKEASAVLDVRDDEIGLRLVDEGAGPVRVGHLLCGQCRW